MRKQSNWDRTRRRMMLQDIFAGIDFSKLNLRKSRDDDIDADDLGLGDDDVAGIKDQTDDNDALPPALEQSIAAIMTAAPGVTREQAAAWLIHTARGRATHAALSKQRKDIPPMDRATELRKMAGEYGVARIAKMITMDGDAHGLTEHELTQLASEEFAKRALPGERPNTTFSRLFQAPESLELRKAIAIARSTPADVTELQPQAKHAETVSAADSATAYAKLQDLGAALRAKDPSLTEAGAFTKAFTENPELARLAHRRPQVGSYAFPR